MHDITNDMIWECAKHDMLTRPGFRHDFANNFDPKWDGFVHGRRVWPQLPPFIQFSPSLYPIDLRTTLW